MYQMIYRISIILYRYEYRIEKTDRYPALLICPCEFKCKIQQQGLVETQI